MKRLVGVVLAVWLSFCGSAWGAFRGVYSDWSVVLQTAGSDAGIPAAIERRIDSMSRDANLIWWTNLPDDPARLAHVVRYARAKGIESVLGSGYWYAGTWGDSGGGEEPRPVRYARLQGGLPAEARVAWRVGLFSQQFSTLSRLHRALPADARPLAWSIADEPPPEAVPTLKRLAERCRAAGIPTTCVSVPEYHAAVIDGLGGTVPLIACDVYPFFEAGLPSNPPLGPAALERTVRTYRDVIARSRRAGVTPILMTQGFGYPGLFAQPTPAQVRWQSWAAIACGSPGAITFAHGVPWVTADGAPASLVEPRSETLTAIGMANSETFSRVGQLQPLLRGAALESPPVWSGSPAAGDVAGLYRLSGGKRLLIVVADPDQSGPRTLSLTVGGASFVVPVAESSAGVWRAWPWPLSRLGAASMQVTIQPGDAWVGEVR